MDLNIKLIIIIMENMATTTYDLSQVITKENIINADDKHAFFDEHKLKLKTYLGTTGLQYNIIQYQKEWLVDELINTTGQFRSVIFDNEYNLLSFSPPKSTKFNKKFLEYNNIHVEEFVEGTMINMFYDKRLNDWEIATRSTVGGNVKFYRHSPETFRQMFFSVFESCGLNKNELKKDHCYSFILQHMGNRIVVPFEKNTLYLADSYKLSENMIVEPSYDEDLVNKHSFLRIHRDTCQNMTSEQYESYIDKYARSGTTDYKIVGVVFKNAQHVRMKVRNPQYEAVRQLRGNQCKDQYNYLALRKDGNIALYLKHYPEDKKRFSVYRTLVHKATKDLYNMYQKCYIFKESELKTFPSEFKTHMYKLHHELYLMKLKPEKNTMQFNDVKEYINSMHPSLLMNMINMNAKSVIVS